MQLRWRRQRRKSSSVQGNSKLSLLDVEDLGHVAADHPADVDAHLLLIAWRWSVLIEASFHVGPLCHVVRAQRIKHTPSPAATRVFFPQPTHPLSRPNHLPS